MNAMGDESIGDNDLLPGPKKDSTLQTDNFSEEIAYSILTYLEEHIHNPNLKIFDPIFLSPPEEQVVAMETTPTY